MTPFEHGWLIGVIEGDGSITVDGCYPVISLKITDLDTAERFAGLMNTKVLGPYHYPNHQMGGKPFYIAKIRGERAYRFMAENAQHFGQRRREQIAIAMRVFPTCEGFA